jgi:hypothetical protein
MKNSTVKIAAAGLFLAFLAMGAVSCKENPVTATVTLMRGSVTVTPENTTLVKPLKLGEALNQGDTVLTGDNSGAIINIKETGSFIEVQSNAVFRLSSLKKNKIELFAQTGNVWVNTAKKPGVKEPYFKLVTPTLVAAVRGTTFYVFKIEDMEGVCHCEGDVDVSRSSSGYRGANHTDNLVVSKGDKSVLLTPEDLKEVGLKHNHSIFEKSPVGPQNQLSPKEFKAFASFLRKKLDQAK